MIGSNALSPARQSMLKCGLTLSGLKITAEPDYHGSTTANDFKNPGTFPTRKKLIKLLGLFKHRDDVWVINEPTDHHVENYRALIRLISKL